MSQPVCFCLACMRSTVLQDDGFYTRNGSPV